LARFRHPSQVECGPYPWTAALQAEVVHAKVKYRFIQTRMAISFERLEDIFAGVDPQGPGCAVGVYVEGEMVFGRGFGLANLEHRIAITPSTVFHIASISKQFVALIAAMLEAEGKLDLDRGLNAFFPELRVGGDITLRQIIHHTGGMRDQWGLLDLAGWRHEDLKTTDDIMRLVTRQRALNFAPGSRFQYINSGYTLIGAIVANITGKSLRRVAQERIFEPLGMRRSHFHDDYHEIVPDRADAYGCDGEGILKINTPAYATAGPTGVFSTVEDFAAWERNLSSPKGVDRDLVATMHMSGKLDNGESTGYGYGLALGFYRGLATAEHAGGDAAFRSHFLRFPDQRFAVAIFCNTPVLQPGKLARRIADRVLADRVEDASISRRGAAAHASRAGGATAPSSETLLSYCGPYRAPGGHDFVTVVFRDCRLLLCSPDGAEYELEPKEEGEFAFVGMDATCRFNLKTGEGVELRTFYGGTETAMLESIKDDGRSNPAISPEDYPGQYFSEELDVTYIVEAHGTVLMLSRGKKGSHPLAPFSLDQFSCPGGVAIQFSRNDAGRVDAMSVSTERVWNVHFARRVDASSDRCRSTRHNIPD
jgi:CubicO group peptidase (beta-lactamase class C family)